ncbi:hypothetical protein [Hydrogenophaga sp. OTU3427]|uniref:hypothetical protein n=1 Tax=Hydrogenophaga sp. OTU3427 TaxID=3043856 RepID=UPI00313C6EE4
MNKDFLWRAGLTAAAAFVVVYSAWGVFKTGVFLPVLMLVPMLALLLPQLRDMAKAKLKIWPGYGWSLGLAFFLMLIQAGWFGDGAIAKRDAEQARLEQELAARVAKVKKDRLDEYNNKKPEILAKLESLISSGKGRDALTLANGYLTVTKDPDLARVQYRADLASMREELKDEKSVPLERLVKIYETLQTEEPGSASAYQAKLKDAKELLAIQEKVKAAAKSRQELEASVTKQFSGFDGSHRNVEAAIKARMHNPGSYEHVQTKYSVGANSITVYTTFRGTNGFGGTVTGFAVAEVDGQGQLLSLRM